MQAATDILSSLRDSFPLARARRLSPVRQFPPVVPMKASALGSALPAKLALCARLEDMQERIWTIGHSTRSITEFLTTLKSHGIEALADVRRFPASRKHPQFNRQPLAQAMEAEGLEYVHFTELGGRRPVRPDSRNLAWRNAGFRGYADYMETATFQEGIARLLPLAQRKRTALLCAEAVWWRCHRSLIADHLKAAGWTVIHLVNTSPGQEHPYTAAARIVDGKLSYAAPAAQIKLPL